MEKADFKNHIDDLPKPDFIREGTTEFTPQSRSKIVTQNTITDDMIPDLEEASENLPQAVHSSKINVDEVWKILKEHLRIYIPKRSFDSWFKGFYLVKIENGIAEFSCAVAYNREIIESTYSHLIRKTLLEITGQKLDFTITLSQSTAKPADSESQYEYYNPKQDQGYEAEGLFSQENNFEKKKEEAITLAQLNPKYLFENFIVGPNNRLAHAVAEAVAENLGHAYNPVFYYGGTGVGKTHLMQAIGNAILEKNPSKKVVYISIEKFLNEMVEAIRTKSTEAFRQRYRPVDLLIIDDIQFVSTYVKTQEELFHTFNTLYQANKQIIIASDRPPQHIENLTDRLKSRFAGGMVVDIQYPDYETRIAILQQHAADNHVTVENPILELIAGNIENNVRELEGAITKVVSMTKLTGQAPTMDEVARMLQFDVESKRKKIKPAKIINVVCEAFDLTPKDIKGKRRTAYIATARQIIMYLLREELEYPLEKVAHEVNRKDHTTVLHACEKISEMIEDNEKMRNKIESCRKKLHE